MGSLGANTDSLTHSFSHIPNPLVIISIHGLFGIDAGFPPLPPKQGMC